MYKNTEKSSKRVASPMEDSGDYITAELNADLPEPNRSGDTPSSDRTVYYNFEHFDGKNPDTTPLSQELDPEMLSAIGTIDENPEFGEDIHKILSEAWLPILKKGITNEDKDNILKEYPVPGNCRLLQAPKLNKEISAAVDVSIREQDQIIAVSQQQLGHGITALNRALDILIKISTAEVCKAVEHLSKSCRILCDLHVSSNQKRINLITPKLDDTLLKAIQGTGRDNTLFGNKLSEKIKHVKNQGQIKKPDLLQPKMSNYTSSTRKRKLSEQAESELNLPSTSSTPTSQNNQKHRKLTQNDRYPGCKEFIKECLLKRKESAGQEKTNFENLTPNIIIQYDPKYKQWWHYCTENNIDKYSPSESQVLNFFKILKKKKLTTITLKVYKKALQLIFGDIVESDAVAYLINKTGNKTEITEEKGNKPEDIEAKRLKNDMNSDEAASSYVSFSLRARI